MKLLQDETGIYLLDGIESIHPVPIKGEPRDQSKITAVHTRINTIGGQRHETAIPWEKASALFLEHHQPVPTAPPAGG